MGDPQPVFEFDDVEVHRRAGTFFRLILAIPHMFWTALWSFAAQIGVVLAWFAIVFTGRYPVGIYRFAAGAERYAAAVSGYVSLLTDIPPGFRVPAGDAPVRLLIPDPKERYGRARAAFRVIIGLPVAVISTALGYVWMAGAVLQWFAIVFTGRRSSEFQSLIVLGLSYQLRANVYFALMTERWPAVHSPDRVAPAGGR